MVAAGRALLQAARLRAMRLRPALALAAALWAAGALAAVAEEGESGGQRIYRWIDENGIAHYTTDPARIPAPLRERVGNPEALSQKPLEARAPDSWADLDVEVSAADGEEDGDGAEGGQELLSGGGTARRNATADDGEAGAADDGSAEDGRAEAEARGGARGESELGSETRGNEEREGETRGSELNGGAWRNGALQSGALQSGRRGFQMRAAAQKIRGSAKIAPRFATAAFATGAAFAGATGVTRLAGAGAESAVRQKPKRLAELNARIAELEARIAAEEDEIKNRISAPDTAPATPGDGSEDEALLARAARLPGWLAELRALREERAALSDGG